MLLAVKNGKADLACMNAVSAAMSVAANDDLVVVDKLTWEPTDEFDKGWFFLYNTLNVWGILRDTEDIFRETKTGT